MRWDNHLPRMSATDATTTLAELKKRILAFSHEREWEQFHAPKNLSMALAAEAGELMEHFLWATSEASRTTVQDPVKRAKIEEELADVIIYALEFANMTGIDAAAAIERKMAANAKKYPVEKARGRSGKYTELWAPQRRTMGLAVTGAARPSAADRSDGMSRDRPREVTR